VPAPTPHEDDPITLGPDAARAAVQRLEDALVDLDAAQRHGDDGSPAAEDTASPVPGSPEPPD
jgi:hypothetical protein